MISQFYMVSSFMYYDCTVLSSFNVGKCHIQCNLRQYGLDILQIISSGFVIFVINNVNCLNSDSSTLAMKLYILYLVLSGLCLNPVVQRWRLSQNVAIGSKKSPQWRP